MASYYCALVLNVLPLLCLNLELSITTLSSFNVGLWYHALAHRCLSFKYRVLMRLWRPENLITILVAVQLSQRRYVIYSRNNFVRH